MELSKNRELNHETNRRKRSTRAAELVFSLHAEKQSTQALVDLINGGIARIIAVKIAADLDSHAPNFT